MKKLYPKYLIIPVFAAALSFSCNRNEVSFGSPVDVTIADTSNKGGEASWKKGDQVKALFDNTMTTLINKSEDGQPALFKGVVKSERYALAKAFYPATCFISKGEGTTANVAIPSSQQPSLSGVDDRADFWIASPVPDVTIKGGESLSTPFKRASAIIKVVLSDAKGDFSGKLVTSVSLDAKSASIVGEAVIDLSESGGLSCKGGKVVTAAYTNSGITINGVDAAWMAVAPATFKADDVITLMVTMQGEEGKAPETQSVDLVCGEIGLSAFQAGKTVTLNVPLKKTYFKGTGTQSDPWLISNFAELSSMSALVAEDQFNAGYYLQTADIAIPEGQDFIPIGNTDHPFGANYDGAGKTISGLKIADVENAGLFGFVGKPEDSSVQKVEIKDLTIDGLTFAGNETGTHAALIGAASKSIELAVSGCTVKNSSVIGADYVASLVAKLAGKSVVDGCSVMKTTVSGDGYVGGISASISSVDLACIKNCVMGSGSQVLGTKGNIGGILGIVAKGVEADVLIDNCAAYCNVMAGTQVTGGIVGGAAPDLTSGEVVKAGGQTVIANCLYQGAQIGTNYTSDANAFLGGVVGLGSRTADTAAEATQRGMSIYIINCVTRPGKVVAKVGPNTARWSFGGIAGGMFAGIHIWNCWSDITEDRLDIYAGNLGYGAITTQMQPNTTGNSADYCFGLIKLKNAGSGVITAENSEVITAAQMTGGYLLEKLTAGVGAYSGGKATLSSWSSGAGGYPTLSTIPADPDKN